MLSKNDLIFFGAIMIWQSPAYRGGMNDAITQAKKIYDKIFNEDE